MGIPDLGGLAGGGGFSGSSASSASFQGGNVSQLSPVTNFNFGEIGLALAAFALIFAVVIFVRHK